MSFSSSSKTETDTETENLSRPNPPPCIFYEESNSDTEPDEFAEDERETENSFLPETQNSNALSLYTVHTYPTFPAKPKKLCVVNFSHLREVKTQGQKRVHYKQALASAN